MEDGAREGLFTIVDDFQELLAVGHVPDSLDVGALPHRDAGEGRILAFALLKGPKDLAREGARRDGVS